MTPIIASPSITINIICRVQEQTFSTHSFLLSSTDFFPLLPGAHFPKSEKKNRKKKQQKTIKHFFYFCLKLANS